MFWVQYRAGVEEWSFMSGPVGVCIAQDSRGPRVSSACKLCAFCYFCVVVLSVAVCQRRKGGREKISKWWGEICGDKYGHTRDILFGLSST